MSNKQAEMNNVIEKDTIAPKGTASVVNQQSQHQDLALIMKNVGLEVGPVSPASTEGSSSTSDDEVSSPEATLDNPEDESEDDWNIVDTPPSTGSTERTESESPKNNKSPHGSQHPMSAFDTTFNVFDDVPTRITMDFQEVRRREQAAALLESAEGEEIEPLKMLKKGAVAALGGTMVGLGLVMIPLPTPCGALVASSGLAVLGTEFDGAREMNEKIVHTTKTHWKTAREKIIEGIEDMEKVEKDPKETSKEGNVELDSGEKQEPLMNLMESKRQETIMNQRQMKRPAFLGEWRKNTGAYLSKHLVPLLRSPTNGAPISEDNSVPDAELTVQSDLETLSELDQGGLETEKTALTTTEVEESQRHALSTSETDENISAVPSIVSM